MSKNKYADKINKPKQKTSNSDNLTDTPVKSEKPKVTAPTNKIGSVLIVGAGISGMQSALDMAEMGYKVYLVEKSPGIGGRMPMLDKTFPTNDCSMCILSPKLVECGRHRNVEVLTTSEVVDLKGEPGKYQVKIIQHPRYIDVTKCLGCGNCAEVCPMNVDDDFNQNMGKRKAVYKLYPQAYPNAYTIDPMKCLKLKNPKACGKCIEACQVDAIDHQMTEKEINIEVGAVILCTGFELFDAKLRGEYGYGIYKNVITSLQFERMLSASGPYKGHVQRPSDNKVPKKVAFIQCVGSRDVCKGNGYCSSVCCMYATKESIIAREHVPGLKSTIFCIDVRAFGKDFEKYYNRAKNDYDVRYVKCMISTVKEDPNTKDLRLRYKNIDGTYTEEVFDMVVLSVGLKPSKEAVELSKIMGLKLNQYNFCELEPNTGVQTSKEGIYVAGAFSGPKDIPETVMQASAAAGDCSTYLAPARNTLVTEREFPPERDISSETPQIGVFVCHCGINISSVVDVPSVVEYAKTLPNVVYAQESLYVCSQDNQAAMIQLIKEHKLNRIVVASCSPRTHKPLFQETMREAGLNKQLFEMANIRDQCSWVHQKEPEKATLKAKELVAMAIAKSAMLRPIKPIVVGVIPACMVIGGGIAGMNTALNLSEQGYKIHLIEKTDKLGGIAHRISGEDTKNYLQKLITAIEDDTNIIIHTNCEVSELGGYVGNFTTKLSNGEQIEHGATVIATGALESKPTEYLYGEDSKVMTQLELDEAITSNDSRLKEAKTIAMIQCVGSREENRPYCSRICCTKSVRLALKLKSMNPNLNVVILYRDIRTYGFNEDYYREAREKGVFFIHYNEDKKPVVTKDGDKLSVCIEDHILNQPVEINPDLLILAAAITPPESNKHLSQIFKVPLNPDSFFLEAHMKLRPVDFAAEGIFMAGLAHGPKNIEESISQAKAAAGRAATVLGKTKLESKGVTAVVDPEKCASCLTCVRLCPFNAPRIDASTHYKAEIEGVICQGCGTCAGECPNKAITLQGYSDKQYISMCDALFSQPTK